MRVRFQKPLLFPRCQMSHWSLRRINVAQQAYAKLAALGSSGIVKGLPHIKTYLSGYLS